MTVAAGVASGSRHIANAAYIAGAIWLASILSYFMHMVWGVSEAGIWRYAAINLLALIYFYVRWSSKDAQHKTFHLLLMWAYLITTAFYAYQLWVGSFAKNAFGISPWWYQLLDNILFELVLILIFVYALIFRRARRNKTKYRSDVDKGFKKAGAVKKTIWDFITGKSGGPPRD